MLVLVNGKRRHTTALVNLLSNRGLGSVGTDLNTLPSLGVERVEVLRDGAAAQYGSDAIAGVMNISLKNSNRDGSVLLNSGLTTAGDGLATLLGVNKGFRLGQKGFLNLTADADYRDRTSRGYARDARVSPVFVTSNPAAEQAALAKAGKTYSDFEQRNGDARVRNLRGLLNARVELSDKLAFYGFGGYNFRRGQASTLWVLPATQAPDIVESLFPYGYQPQVNTRIHDGAGTVGVVLGQTGPNHWTLDVSNTSGYNRMTYDLENTLNATLGAASPTTFGNAGGFQFLQNVTNATANRFFDQVLAGTNVAFGAEFRADRYEIMRGDERAEAEYDLGKPDSQQGAQGFSGFGGASAVVGTRTNVGTFLDVEADVTKNWSVSGALRYENYSTFGSAFIYKATTRVQATKYLALRGAFNTGFRAPSLQQSLYRQITQRPGVSGVVYAGIFNNQDEPAGAGRCARPHARKVAQRKRRPGPDAHARFFADGRCLSD
ncbi:TonB-dependent receptor plug domain-containing protein [Hymenobacter humi]|uniref:TonB-dependent receptor plug domain-containing protein n=1 Tax=Hymenobacter humi TaxID=1411620 RepID=A0ABW2U8G9_9BACT